MCSSLNKIIKVAAAAGACTAAAVAGTAALTGEMLMNRNLVLPESISKLVTKCDMSNLEGLKNRNLAWLENYGYEKHYIENDRGEGLVGYLMKAETESDVYCLGVHGYRVTGKIEFCGFAQYYLKHGVNMFFIDHTASGESDGTYCTFGYRETQDCLKWIDYMKETFGKDIKIILHGVSMGAATVDMLCGSGKLPDNVKMAVADCGYSSGTEMFREKFGSVKILPALVDKITKLRFGFGFDDINPVESVKNAEIPMLFVHGSGDTFVPYKMSFDVYGACNSQDKEILIIEGANHAQSWVDGQDKYEAKLDEWIKKYI